MRKALKRRVVVSAAALAALASSGRLMAQVTATFDGNAAVGTVGDNATWADVNNWTVNGVSDTTLPANAAPGDNVTFGGGTAGATIALGGARVVNTLTFNRNYTLGPATDTLTLNTAAVSVTTGNTGTINAIVAGAAGISLTGGGTLYLNRATGNTFTGNITVDGAGTTLAYNGTNSSADPTALGAAGARTITLTNGGAISVAGGTLSNPTGTTKSFVIGTGGGTIHAAAGQTLQLDDAGQFSGTGALTKSGPGTLFLNSQGFTYTGASVTISGGRLRASNAGSLGATNVPITVASGASFDVTATLSGTKPITAGGVGVDANTGAIAATTGTGVANGAVTLTADTSLGGNGTLTLSGVINDGASTFNVTKIGTGLLVLSNTNLYGGNTTVSAGTLRGTIATNIPTTGNLNLNGGAFETVGATYAGTLGTGAGQVQLPGGASGFSSGLAAGVTVNLDGAATTLTWGTTPNFNPSSLVLSSASALGALNFQNPIDLGGATRTFTTNATPTAGTVATLSGAISGTGAGLTKTGTGVLALGNAANSYDGNTLVSGGVLRGTLGTSIPSTGNLSLAGGSLETNANVTAALGTGAGQVQLPSGASGFSAFTNPVVVNVGGAGATLQFGGATFSPSTLIVNAASATSTLDLQNPLDLNGATRTFAGNGTGTNIGTISSDIGTSTGTAGVTVNGTGILAFTGNNTYNGTTTLTAGTLRVGEAANLGAATAPVTFNGGMLQVTGTTLQNFGARTVTYTSTPNFDIADAANTFTMPNSPLLTTGTMIKNGPGTLKLGEGTSDNILTQLQINGGILDLGNSDLQVNNGGSTTIRTSTGSGTINASGTGAIELTVSDGDAGAANGTTLTINAPIKGAFRYENFVATDGTGVTILTNVNNSFSGGVAINSSVLSVPMIGNTGSNSPLGTGGTISITNNLSTLRYTGTGETTNKVINMSGTTGPATLEMAGTGTLTFTSNLTSGAGSKNLNLIGSTAGIGEISGIIPNNSGANITSIVKNGTGTWKLSGPNTFTGNVTVTQGTIIATNNSSLGTGTKNIALSNGTAGNPQLHLDGSGGNITLPSTFTYQTSNIGVSGAGGAFVNLAGDNTIQGTINPTSGGGDSAIQVNAGTLTISANVTTATTGLGTRSLRFRGPGDGTLSGTVTNGSSTVGLVQEGTGTWAITGNANTFSGGVTITSGSLLANNASGSATGPSAITVSGTGVFGGTGSVSGAVTVNSGGAIAPGASIESLGTGNVAFNDGSKFNVETGAGNASDLLAITGTINLTSTSDTLNLFTSDPGTFVIATFTGGAVAGTNVFDTVTMNGGTLSFPNPDVAIAYNTNDITVTVTNVVPEPGSAALLGIAAAGLLARRRRAAK